MQRPDPFVLRVCVGLIRAFAALVPAAWRRDWRAEWEGEVRGRWNGLEGDDRLDWRIQVDLIRRVLGALPDAAWLRRQFTADADAVHDLRHGARMLWKAPSFTVSAVLILALGLGGTVAIVSLLDTLVLRPLPYADADRVVTIWTRLASQPGQLDDVSPADFLDWRERSRSFSTVAAAIPYSFDYTGGGEPEVFFGAQVTEGFWDALGMRPLLGRPFTPDEHARGGRRSVIITYGLWQSKFGGDPGILNRPLALDGEPWTIVGVLPREFAPQLFQRPGELSVWTPKVIQEHEKRTRGSAWWNVIGRLRPGVTLEEAQLEMDAISAALATEHPRVNANRAARVVSMRDHLMGEVRLPLLLMLGAVLLVLGIGCANVASLLLARGMQRDREFAIRSALGAGRLRLVRQVMTESVLLALVALIIGLGIAHWMLQGIVALAPPGVLRLQEAAIDGRILVFASALTTATALGFGLVPALLLPARSRAVLRERNASGPRARLRRGLVAAEVAFALVLLVAAGLLIRSFARLVAVDPGFSARNVVALQVFAWDRTGTPDRIRGFFDATLARMRAIPGVQQAGAVSAMPFALSNIDIKTTFEVAGKAEAAPGEQRGAYLTIATPGYFQAMSIPLREGRLLEERDSAQAPLSAVISDDLRRREWPDESPIGRRIRLVWQGEPIEADIVGVVARVRHERLDRAPRPEVFLPLAQVPFASMTYVLRGSGPPSALIEATRREIWAVDPLQTIYDSAGVEALVDASLVRERFSMTLMSAFALLALVLCASGIYGIISFTTAQRTREIGVRMALGADRAAIRRMVLREGAGVIALGLAVGITGALATSRYIQSLLFEVRPGDPATLGAVCLVLSVVGLAACYVPARRATRVDPLVALRDE